MEEENIGQTINLCDISHVCNNIGLQEILSINIYVQYTHPFAVTFAFTVVPAFCDHPFSQKDVAFN